jgi:ABC-type uncharacterized transport system fused permease/ATPase subunit
MFLPQVPYMPLGRLRTVVSYPAEPIDDDTRLRRALDDGQEFALYKGLRTELPDCILVSVSHRSGVGQHHTRQLELLGRGPWRLTDL